MSKFIDTEAGRQLLKDHFFNFFSERDLIDPNFLEWEATWSNFPIIEDIQKLFIKWKEWGRFINGVHPWEFKGFVFKYLEENQRKGDHASYYNLEQFYDNPKNSKADLPNNLAHSIEYDGRLYLYTGSYLNSLELLVIENQ